MGSLVPNRRSGSRRYSLTNRKGQILQKVFGIGIIPNRNMNDRSLGPGWKRDGGRIENCIDRPAPGFCDVVAVPRTASTA